jgi:hypothetical protein
MKKVYFENPVNIYDLKKTYSDDVEFISDTTTFPLVSGIVYEGPLNKVIKGKLRAKDMKKKVDRLLEVYKRRLFRHWDDHVDQLLHKLSLPTTAVQKGGPGSGCNPAVGICGRPSTGVTETPTIAPRQFVDAKAADEWGNKNYGEWSNSLTAKEIEIVSYMKSNNFIHIQDELRGNVPITSALSPMRVEILDNMLSRTKTLEPIITFRLARIPKEIQFKEGQIFTDKGYVSTTLDKTQVKGFIGPRGKEENILMNITVPKGSPGAYLETERLINIIPNADEREFLLPRNTKFKVTSIENNPVKPLNKIINVEVLNG